jgi:glycerol-3-phosphate dehydrogenase (NAD(P)+)
MSVEAFQSAGILGAGSWGTALATLIAQRGVPVALWGHNAQHIDAIRSARTNEAYLPGIELPVSIEATDSLETVSRADAVLFVTPSKAIREVARQFAETPPAKGTVLVTCTKGIERGSGLRMSEVLHEYFPENPVAVLSGPSHAEEVGRQMPTAVVLGCGDASVGQALQQTISSPFFRAYTSADIPGIELGGALKNIFAIAAGAGDGLGLGDNSKAALVTRALAELIRLGIALGGRRETFQGLSGIGDLMVTCFSRHSRNRSVGERLGRGESLEAITGSMQMVAEGVPTALSAFECARERGIRTPIIDAVHAVLYEDRPVRDAMMSLLNRDPRPEEDDAAGA